MSEEKKDFELKEEELEKVSGGYSVNEDGTIVASMGDVFKIGNGNIRVVVTKDFNSSTDSFIYFKQVFPEHTDFGFGDYTPFSVFFTSLNAQYYEHINM